MSRQELIDVALGRSPADTVIQNGKLVNVWTAGIEEADIAIRAGRVAAVGDVGYCIGEQTRRVDAEGRFLVPGLIEGHLHQYHSYLGVNAFVEAMLSHGITATADAFYGPGVVAGMRGIEFFKTAFEAMPMRLIFLVPTIAWLQNRDLGLTPTPEAIKLDDMLEMLAWDDCYGLEEPQPFPVLDHLPEYVQLLEAALKVRKTISGHAEGLSERQVQAYVAAGAACDHESDTFADAVLKTRLGMKLLAREGSGCRNLRQVIRATTEAKVDPHMFGFSSDVASAEKLRDEGTTDEAIRVAISAGVPPVTAVQMGTLNIAQTFHAEQDIGSIAPGRYADIVLVTDLAAFEIDGVLVGGETVVENMSFVADLPETTYPQRFYETVRLPRTLTVDDFLVPASGPVEVRVIGVNDGSLVTDERRAVLSPREGWLYPDVQSDVLTLAMIDRHGKGTGIGLGFAQGFGLKRGAFATTANATCENVVVVGADVDDMRLAAAHVASIGGGKAVVSDGKVISTVALPILGLHAEGSLASVMEAFDETLLAIKELGCTLENPYSQLEFAFVCGSLGDIKLSEEGLLLIHPPQKVDVVVRPAGS